MNEELIEVRNLRMEDYEQMAEVTRRCYAGIGGLPWGLQHIGKLLDLFPEGQLCVTVGGKPVAFALAIIVDYPKFGDAHRYEDITGKLSFSTFDRDGDVLYGLDMMVDPDYRNMRLGGRLYDARKALCENLGLRAIIAGGRIPGYADHASQMTPKEYIARVAQKDLYDPVLSFQIANGFHVRKVLTGYLHFDTESKAYATLIEWNNIYWQPKTDLHKRQRSLVRIGLVQWQMRPIESLESLLQQTEFYVDAMGAVRADFLLLPELFHMGMMARFGDATPAQAIRHLADDTPAICDRLSQLAVSYNINIIAGSLPLKENGKLYNVAYLLRRDGSREEQRKIHITPGERRWWGMVGGNQLRAFDTDCGKIGILICYDSEFPELPRILADQGMQILFVPFLTEMKNGYQRVRLCTRARAIENECYVAIAGAVGSLPKVQASDTHYAQSAVFTPSDYAFPGDSIINEAAPNAEALMVAEVNLDLLRTLHEHGTVTILKDRLPELYQLRWNGPEAND
ncbi:bifunctional GNAT family N-acetyltransferase/carbon-nitrogen hydrolase family protein [Pseudomarimonas salicorniae]|uniref:Bifunctional GNAT family N-acetyltransferase/carbon-nitrogen hydrolase family protein n=1 Tax=Pseudomarimonas salicorniae TaxID=2933270 RepID=A0ABT0GJA3_9GAMM|nr:bifunctional GNAT family N-acetyltransferase/carbon-nitrogen hydrolase family protein [Lysobacter sp. CAU 1642]